MHKHAELDGFINGLSYPSQEEPGESIKVAYELRGLPDSILLNTIGYNQPTQGEKLAMRVTSGSPKLSMHGDKSEWLEQFQGSPLYEQAIGLCEQDLQMEQQHLQARMQRRQQDQGWEQENNDRDMMRIQKHQLTLALHKQKAQQQAAVAVASMPSAPGPMGAPPGAEGEAPGGAAAEPAIPAEAPPEAAAQAMQAADAEKQAMRKWAMDDKEIKAKAQTYLEKNPHMGVGISSLKDKADLKALLPFGSTYIGANRASNAGEDAVMGAARGIGGGLAGGMAGSALGLGTPLSLPLGMAGNVYGTHLATRKYLQKGKKKESQVRLTIMRLRKQANVLHEEKVLMKVTDFLKGQKAGNVLGSLGRRQGKKLIRKPTSKAVAQRGLNTMKSLL